jgi:hypothetical protein
MAWIKVRSFIVVGLMFLANNAFAQESLWKTFSPSAAQSVPSYSGGLSPFPQKQKKVVELEFEKVEPVTDIEVIEADSSLTEEEKRLMLTTSILAELKSFLSEESVFIPNLDDVVVEATAKAKGEYKALIKRKWMKKGDELTVPVDEARDALDLLERLRSVDEHLAETVENAVLDRTSGKGQEVISIVQIENDRVIMQDSTGQEYVLNFIKAPF